MTPPQHVRSLLAGAAIGAATWPALALALPSLPGWVRFILAGGLFVFGPGAALTWHALRQESLSRRIVLALGFGLAAAPLMGHALATAGLIALYPFLASAMTGAVLARAPLLTPRATAPLLPLAMLCLVALAMSFFTYANRVVTDTERTAYYGEYDTYDLTYYAAIASELTHTIPPEAPFSAGRSLNHAFYPQLPVALLRVHAEVPILDSYFFYIWPAYLALTALMCYVFIESIASRGAAWLSALLLLLGSDFSYLAKWFYPSLNPRWDDVMWSANFLSPAAETLLFNNWGPTLPVVFACLYALAADERHPGRLWIVLAGGCLAVTAQFKPFAFVSLTAGIAAAAFVSRRDRPSLRRYLAVIAVAAVVSTPYVLRMVRLADDASVYFTLDFFSLPRTVLARLNLDRAWLIWATSVGLSGTAKTALVGAIGTPLFLVGGLGFRLVGCPALAACVRHPLSHAPIWRVLSWTIVAAIAAPFFISTAPAMYEGLQFHQLALFLLPIFVAKVVISSRGSTRQMVASAAIVAIACPSTIHYLHRKWENAHRQAFTISTDEMHAANFLRLIDANKVVLLHNHPHRANLMVIASERRSVLAWGRYVRDSEERERDIKRFYRSSRISERYALDFLAAYQPTHVAVYPASDHVHPMALAQMRPVFTSSSVILYEVPEELRSSRPTLPEN